MTFPSQRQWAYALRWRLRAQQKPYPDGIFEWHELEELRDLLDERLRTGESAPLVEGALLPSVPSTPSPLPPPQRWPVAPRPDSAGQRPT
jgi:hypothetical protein